MTKILVVDDEKQICRILTLFLTKQGGFEVQSAFNGEEALRIIEKEKFDVMLMDMNMPGLSGEKLLERLKAEGFNTPVIVLTGSLGGPLRPGQFGFVKDFVYKPTDLNELLEKIKAVLKGN